MAAFTMAVNKIQSQTNNISSNTSMSHARWGKKRDWPTVATRIPKELKKELQTKHPKEGEVSQVLHQLIEKYVQGKILGIKVV